MRRLRRLLGSLIVVTILPSLATAQHLGRTVTDVRVEIAGQPVIDPTVLGLIETRVGEPLSMLQVRSTIDHLIGLGRFEDVRVTASPSAQGVMLRWMLLALRRIARVSVAGTPELSAATIRTELADRFGSLPAAGRVPEMVAALQAFYADRGFNRATILPRIQEEDPSPERVELVLTITAGERVTIGSAMVTGSPLEAPAGIAALPERAVARLRAAGCRLPLRCRRHGSPARSITGLEHDALNQHPTDLLRGDVDQPHGGNHHDQDRDEGLRGALVGKALAPRALPLRAVAAGRAGPWMRARG